jgi:transcription elongation GreA/GreB family factor
MAESQTDEIKLKCIYGNKVKLRNLRTNDESNYELVTYTKEALDENKISNYTEIGNAIWAKHEGDEVEIEITGVGKDFYRIESIENA